MKVLTIVATVTVVLAISSTASATTVIGFDAAAYRPSNDGTLEFGTATEYVTEDGMFASTPKAGQKTLYGTEYFDGWSLSDIGNIQYTCKRVEGVARPYTNAVITDGSGHYGVISSQGGTQLGSTVVVGTIEVEGVTKNVIEEHYRFDFADNSGNQLYGFRFYEPNPDSWSGQPAWWGSGVNIVWSDISSWDLLGIGDTRPLNSGEAALGYPRGPVDHGLSIVWGDSANNYLGDMDIYDVTVYDALGEDYVAGVPEPATMALLALGGLLIRRKK